MIASIVTRFRCLPRMQVISTLLEHVIGVLFFFVPHRNSVLDDKEGRVDDRERRVVRVRRPQNDVRPMHVVQKGPSVSFAHGCIEADLQESAAGLHGSWGVPITFDEHVTQSIGAARVHLVLNNRLNASVARFSSPSVPMNVLFEDVGVVCGNSVLFFASGKGKFVEGGGLCALQVRVNVGDNITIMRW